MNYIRPVVMLWLGVLLGYTPADSQVDQIRINEVSYEENWIELFNAGTETVDVSELLLCTRPDYQSVGALEIMGAGTVEMEPGAYTVVFWDPNRDADGDAGTVDGEVGLYTSAPFNSPDNLLDYMAFGAAQDDGRASVAEQAGIWMADAFAAVAPAGQTLAFFGGGGAPTENWGSAKPTPNAGNMRASTDVGLQLVAEGLTHPVSLLEAPDESGRLFIVDQAGQVRIVGADGTLQPMPFLDVSDRMVELRSGFDERGLLGLAFHPSYADNGRFFVYYSAPLRDGAPTDYNHTSRLSEFTVSDGDPDRADPASERILLEIDEPQFNHNGGAIAFSPEDGYLYVAVGDGGNADDVGLGHVDDWYDANDGGNAQNVEANLLGKILRIDVDSGDPFAIPADNPFVGTAGLDEIYAYGLRNPYRMSFDMGGDHAFYVADVGQNRWEEVNRVMLGGNYGWNVLEAAHCFDTSNPDSDAESCPDAVEAAGSPIDGDPLVAPVIEYLNSRQEGGLGRAVVGGYVYRGSALPDLEGWYLFGDWSAGGSPNGVLFAAESQEEGMWSFSELGLPDEEGGQLDGYLLGFGQDQAGEVYVLTSAETGPTGNTGQVFQLVAPGDPTPTEEAPELPSVIRLTQNFPNPFNPATTIRFELAAAGPVTLAVYDVLGRRVALLLDRAIPAGSHEVRWDGRDDEGRSVASGTYLYRLRAGEATATRVMTMLK